MSSDIQAGLQDFRSLCDQTLKAWNQYKFQGNSRGTPAQFFAQKWDDQSLMPASSKSGVSIPKWLKNLATALPIAVGVATIIPLGPLGVGIAAFTTAAILGPRLVVDKVFKPIEHNDSVSREAFPVMQDDLKKIVSVATELAKSANRELASQGAPESERLEFIEDVETTLHQFAGEAFGATSEDISRGELLGGKVKRQKDSTAMVKLKKALDEIGHEKEHRPMRYGPGSETGNPTVDRTLETGLDRGQPPIDPNIGR